VGLAPALPNAPGDPTRISIRVYSNEYGDDDESTLDTNARLVDWFNH
jgi:hypothetical protein